MQMKESSTNRHSSSDRNERRRSTTSLHRPSKETKRTHFVVPSVGENRPKRKTQKFSSISASKLTSILGEQAIDFVKFSCHADKSKLTSTSSSQAMINSTIGSYDLHGRKIQRKLGVLSTSKHSTKINETTESSQQSHSRSCETELPLDDLISTASTSSAVSQTQTALATPEQSSPDNSHLLSADNVNSSLANTIQQNGSPNLHERSSTTSLVEHHTTNALAQNNKSLHTMNVHSGTDFSVESKIQREYEQREQGSRMRHNNRQRATRSTVFVNNSEFIESSQEERRHGREMLRQQIEDVRSRKQREAEEEADLQRRDDERVEREQRMLRARWSQELLAESGSEKHSGESLPSSIPTNASSSHMGQTHSLPRIHETEKSDSSVSKAESPKSNIKHRRNEEQIKCFENIDNNKVFQYDELQRFCQELLVEQKKLRNDLVAEKNHRINTKRQPVKNLVSNDELDILRERVNEMELKQRRDENVPPSTSHWPTSTHHHLTTPTLSNPVRNRPLSPQLSRTTRLHKAQFVSHPARSELTPPCKVSSPPTQILSNYPRRRLEWLSRSKAGVPIPGSVSSPHNTCAGEQPLPAHSTSRSLTHNDELGSVMTSFIQPNDEKALNDVFGAHTPSPLPHLSENSQARVTRRTVRDIPHRAVRRMRPRVLDPFIRSTLPITQHHA